MTEQIVAHKTTDGKIFEDEAQAEAHESRLIAMIQVTDLLRSSDSVYLNSFTLSDLTEYMIDNRDAFIRALMGQEETGDDAPAEDDAEVQAQLEAIEAERDTLDQSTLDPPETLPVLDALDMPVVFESPSAADAEALAVHLSEPRADDDIPF